MFKSARVGIMRSELGLENAATRLALAQDVPDQVAFGFAQKRVPPADKPRRYAAPQHAPERVPA